MATTKYEKKQRCPRCGNWLTPESLYEWKEKWKGNALGIFHHPKEEDLKKETSYVCTSCGYHTDFIGSPNKRVQEVLRDIIRDNLSNEDRIKYARQANDKEAMQVLYEVLRLHLDAKQDTNGLAALVIGIMPQKIREDVLMEINNMIEVEKVWKHVESRVTSMKEINFGDLAAALTL